MINSLYTYVLTLVLFLGIDMIWLNYIAKSFYSNEIGHLFAKSPNLIAAVIFYLIFPIGVLIFVLNPALKDNSWSTALIFGALFGLFTYMTYDLTNLATLNNWSWKVTVIDILWGILLTALVSLIVFFLRQGK